ncbi:MAG: hypothetical protein IJO83_07870 [Clostridia bacterium]|nr:hypothetical protein [Clostridia bacterium]
MFHAAHEIALHRAVHLAPDEATAFIFEMYKHLSGNELHVGTKADEKRNSYEAQNVDISLAKAMEEITANNLLYLYGNNETKFRNAIESIINGTNQKAKTGLEKFIECLKDVVRKLREILQGKSPEERAQIQADIDTVTRLRKQFEGVVAKAVENKKALESKTTQKNTTTEGGVRFSLKGFRVDGIEVYETSDEVMNMSVSERKKRYVQLMNNEYAGRTARFERNGHTYYAEFDRKNLGKPMYGDSRSSTSGKKALTRVGADGDIFDLVENSKYSHSKPDTKNHKNTDYFDYFIKTVQIDNRVYDLLADVKKQYGKNGGYVYTLILVDNKKIKAAPTKVIKNDAFKVVETTSTAGQSVTSDTSTATNIISQESTSVKREFSLKDSEGNILTEAQQEYFKDSKVRDKDGNLLVMYQGASEDFTVFDRKKSSYANLYGRGFYFTTSERHARQYGNTKAYYLNIKHPVSTTETTITKAQLRKFLEAVAENEDYSFENYGYEATVDSVLASVYGKSDFLMLNDVSQTAIGDLVEAAELFNEINGTDYDGFMLDTETVTFNSEQAKLTVNEKPTNNPDTRFSLKETDAIEIEGKERYNESRSYSLKSEYWHTDLSKAQLKQVGKWLRQAGAPEATRITDTANWYKGRIDGDSLFVIYSTEVPTDPTIMYEVKGRNAKAELNTLQRMLEAIENGNIRIQENISGLLDSDWVQEKHGVENNNVGPGERIGNTGYAAVLQGKSSEFIGSEAFRNVVYDLFKKQEQGRELNKGKSHSLKGTSNTSSDGAVKRSLSKSLKKYLDDGMISTEAYEELIEKYGAIATGEKPYRDVQVPRKTAKNKKVSQTVRTILEAKVTPDEVAGESIAYLSVLKSETRTVVSVCGARSSNTYALSLFDRGTARRPPFIVHRTRSGSGSTSFATLSRYRT